MTKTREELVLEYTLRLRDFGFDRRQAPGLATILAELAERQQPGGETGKVCAGCGYPKDDFGVCNLCIGRKAQPAPAYGEAVTVELGKVQGYRCSSDGGCGTMVPVLADDHPDLAAWLPTDRVFDAARLDQAARVEQATRGLRERIAALEAEVAKLRYSDEELARVCAAFPSDAASEIVPAETVRVLVEQRDANAKAAQELGELRELARAAGHVQLIPVTGVALRYAETNVRFRALLGIASPAERGGERE